MTDRHLTSDCHPTSEHHEQARRATLDRVAEWSPDRSFDLGDTHNKGEPSLCVGEAA